MPGIRTVSGAPGQFLVVQEGGDPSRCRAYAARSTSGDELPDVEGNRRLVAGEAWQWCEPLELVEA